MAVSKAGPLLLPISLTQGPKDPGIHLPYSLLCVHRDCPVGGLDHLQDEEELGVPAGDEERDAQLRALLRNPPGRIPVILPGDGQGAEDVSSQGELLIPQSWEQAIYIFCPQVTIFHSFTQSLPISTFPQSFSVQLVAARPALLLAHLHLRRDEEVPTQAEPR